MFIGDTWIYTYFLNEFNEHVQEYQIWNNNSKFVQRLRYGHQLWTVDNITKVLHMAKMGLLQLLLKSLLNDEDTYYRSLRKPC